MLRTLLETGLVPRTKPDLPHWAAVLILATYPGLAAASPSDLLREPPAVAAEAMVKGQPLEAQAELFSLYARYVEIVTQRRDEGWHAGLLSGEIVETTSDNPRPPMRIPS
jgi:hypothetical protein